MRKWIILQITLHYFQCRIAALSSADLAWILLDQKLQRHDLSRNGQLSTNKQLDTGKY